MVRPILPKESIGRSCLKVFVGGLNRLFLEQVEAVEVLLAAPDNHYVALSQHGVAAGDGDGLALVLERHDGQTFLAGELEIGEGFVYPLPRDFSLDQGFVIAEVHVVHERRRGQGAGAVPSFARMRVRTAPAR